MTDFLGEVNNYFSENSKRVARYAPYRPAG